MVVVVLVAVMVVLVSVDVVVAGISQVRVLHRTTHMPVA